MKKKPYFVLLALGLFSPMQADELPRVIGVGVACIDVLISVEEDFLLEHLPGQKGECSPLDQDALLHIQKMSSSPAKLVPGGCSANTIRALAKLGEPCALFSHVGDDALGRRIAEGLSNLHITNYLSVFPHYITDWALCMVTPNGERTIRFIHQDTPYLDVPSGVFQGAEMVYIEAYRLRFGDFVERVIDLAKHSQTKVAFNLGNESIILKHKERLLKLLADVDIVFANEREIFALTGLSPEEGCLELQKLCPLIVVTQGPKDCLIGHNGTILAIPTTPSHPIDTTGAGDFFAAGFLHGYLAGQPLAACAQIGHILGTAIIGVVGAELPEEKWEEVRYLIPQQQLLPQ